MKRSSQAVQVGGRVPRDPNSPEIIEIATWAVQENNKEKGTSLKFVRAFEAESQVVEGTMYYIGLEASDELELVRNYKAQVWDKPWIQFRELEEFKPYWQNNERIPVAN